VTSVFLGQDPSVDAHFTTLGLRNDCLQLTWLILYYQRMLSKMITENKHCNS